MGRACECCGSCKDVDYYFNVDRYGHNAICFVKERTVTYEEIYVKDGFLYKLFSMKIIDDAGDIYYKDDKAVCGNTWESEILQTDILRGYQIGTEEQYPGINKYDLYRKRIVKVTKFVRKLILEFNLHDIYDPFLTLWSNDNVARITLRVGGVIPAHEKPSIFGGVDKGFFSTDFKVNGVVKDLNHESLNFDSFDGAADGANLLYTNEHHNSYSMQEFSVGSLKQYLGNVDIGQDNKFSLFFRPIEYTEVVDIYEEKYKFLQENEDPEIEFEERHYPSIPVPHELDGSKFVFGYWPRNDTFGPIWMEIFRLSYNYISFDDYTGKNQLNVDNYDKWLRNHSNKDSDWHTCFKRIAEGEYVSTCSYSEALIGVNQFLNEEYFLDGGKLEFEIFKSKTSNKKSGAFSSYFKGLYEIAYDRMDEGEIEVQTYCSPDDGGDKRWRWPLGWEDEEYRDSESFPYVIISQPPEIIKNDEVPPNGRYWSIEYTYKPPPKTTNPMFTSQRPYIHKFRYTQNGSHEITIAEYSSTYEDQVGAINVFRGDRINFEKLESFVGFNYFTIRDCVIESTGGWRTSSSVYQGGDIKEKYVTVPNYPVEESFEPANIRFKLISPRYYPDKLYIRSGKGCLNGCVDGPHRPEWRVLYQGVGSAAAGDFTYAQHGLPTDDENPYRGILYYGGFIGSDVNKAECVTILESEITQPKINEGFIRDITYAKGVNNADYIPSAKTFFATGGVSADPTAVILTNFTFRGGTGGVGNPVFDGTYGPEEYPDDLLHTLGQGGIGALGDYNYTRCHHFYDEIETYRFFVGTTDAGYYNLTTFADANPSLIIAAGSWTQRFFIAEPPSTREYYINDFECIDIWMSKSVDHTPYDVDAKFWSDHIIETVHEPWSSSDSFDLFVKEESKNFHVVAGQREMILGTWDEGGRFDYSARWEWGSRYEFTVYQEGYVAGAGIRFRLYDDFFGYGDTKSSSADFFAIHQQWVPSIQQDEQLTQDQIDTIAGYLTDFDYWYQIKGKIVVPKEGEEDLIIEDAYFNIGSNGSLNGPFSSSGFVPAPDRYAVYDTVKIKFLGVPAGYKTEELVYEDVPLWPSNGIYDLPAQRNIMHTSEFPSQIITDAYVPRVNRRERQIKNPSLLPEERPECEGTYYVRNNSIITVEYNVGVWTGSPEVVTEDTTVTIGPLPLRGSPTVPDPYGFYNPYSGMDETISHFSDPMPFACRDLGGSSFDWPDTCIAYDYHIWGFDTSYNQTTLTFTNALYEGDTAEIDVIVGYLKKPETTFDNVYTVGAISNGGISDSQRTYFYPDDSAITVTYKKTVEAFDCKLPLLDFGYDDLLHKDTALNLAFYKRITAEKKSVLDEEDLEVIRNGHNYYEYTGFYGPVRDTGFLTDQEKNTFQAQTYGLYSDSEQQQHFLDKYGVDTYIHPNYIKAVPEYIGRAIDSASLAMFSGDEHLTYHHRSFRIPFKSTLSYDQYCPPDSPRAGRDRVYACPMEVPGERYPPTYYEKEDCVSVSATSIKEWPGNEPGLGYGGGIPVNANEKIEYRVSLDFVHIKDYSFTLGGRQGR
jgi:hypothetical protein